MDQPSILVCTDRQKTEAMANRITNATIDSGTIETQAFNLLITKLTFFFIVFPC